MGIHSSQPVAIYLLELMEPLDELRHVLQKPTRQRRITSTSTDKEPHRRNLLRHRAVYDEIGYAPPRCAGGRHAPLRVAVLELHDALDADVAPLRALLFEEV